MSDRFRCPSAVFKVMLQFRLCLPLAFSWGVEKCDCGADADIPFWYGWHWSKRCGKACRNLNHNRVRDIIAAMYRSLKVDVEVEAKGLFRQLTSYGDFKPADVLLPGSDTAHGSREALDIAITDPTGKVALRRQSSWRPLMAAAIRHKDKMAVFATQKAQAGVGGLPFVKVPLVFETTGAMGKETEKWWQGVLILERKSRDPALPVSRKDQDLDWSFTANAFSSYWRQAISMSMARTMAESVIASIGKNQKEGVVAVHPVLDVH